MLEGCEIKKARQRDGLEILVKIGTKILKSQKSFEITKEKGVTALNKVQDLPQYQQVNVQTKVMHAGKPFELRNGGKVQEAVIADASGHAILNI